MAAGGCSSVDVVDGLKTAGQKVSSVNAKLSTERRETAPRIFTAVNIHFVVSGEQLDEAIVAKVTADSLEKYCSVCLMLGAGVEMTHSWEIV
ncbi:osmotically inducible protein OsmC [Vibrio vulnificus]|nr:osmotically inducible protein OsmC [Vibrio vulnificus]